MCPTEGVWGQEQWVRRGVNRAVVPIATNQEGKGAPQLVVGRIPTSSFPFPLPWTKSMGLNSFNCPGYGTRSKAMGALPPNPLENKNKRFKPLPVVRVPRTTGREEWGLFAPKPLTRNRVPGPHQWVHCTLDTIVPGQLLFSPRVTHAHIQITSLRLIIPPCHEPAQLDLFLRLARRFAVNRSHTGRKSSRNTISQRNPSRSIRRRA